MKTFLSVTFSIIITSSSAFGWVIDEPVDYSKQLQQADFVGVVEVTKIVETGRKKDILPDQRVQFRELSLELKVLTAFKGNGVTIKCCIYREPTQAELLADGVSENDLFVIYSNLITSETLHLFPARVSQGTHLLAYLKAEGSAHYPLSGYLNSSRSLLNIEPSNLVNSHPRTKEAEQDGTGQPATRPESKSEGRDKPQPESGGRSQ